MNDSADAKLYSYLIVSKTLIRELAEKSSDIFTKEADIIRNAEQDAPLQLIKLNHLYRELCAEYDKKIEANFHEWKKFEESLAPLHNNVL